ncbi:hypothetical protein LXL04_031903 [Taraxacum kok-saghyz]
MSGREKQKCRAVEEAEMQRPEEKLRSAEDARSKVHAVEEEKLRWRLLGRVLNSSWSLKTREMRESREGSARLFSRATPPKIILVFREELRRMNQSEIDQLLRDPNILGDIEIGRLSDNNQWGTMEMDEVATGGAPNDHGYIEIGRTCDYSGYGSSEVNQSEKLVVRLVFCDCHLA